MPVGRAALAALVVGAALGFVFAARSAPLIAAGTFLILWRGIGTRALVAAAGALLLVVVPLLTLVVPVRDPGGFNFEYAHERIAVHWVTVAAVVLLDPRAGPDAQYGHGPSRSRATTRALIARLRANHGSSASWRSALRARARPRSGTRSYSASEPVRPA